MVLLFDQFLTLYQMIFGFKSPKKICTPLIQFYISFYYFFFSNTGYPTTRKLHECYPPTVLKGPWSHQLKGISKTSLPILHLLASQYLQAPLAFLTRIHLSFAPILACNWICIHLAWQSFSESTNSGSQNQNEALFIKSISTKL